MIDDDLYYILLDEVQLVPRFEEVLNSLLRIENADVYVTGSNSKFLSSDIITEFRGRGDEIHLYPLSLAEYCEGTGQNPRDAWKDYYTYGGLPHILALDTEKKKLDYLTNLFESVYLIDILERHKIKNKAEFEELIRIIASGIGAPTNPAKLSHTFKSVKKIGISSVTINRYLDYMQDAFLIEKLSASTSRARSILATCLNTTSQTLASETPYWDFANKKRLTSWRTSYTMNCAAVDAR